MIDKLMKLKKDKGDIPPMEKDAKMDVLKQIKGMANGMMTDKLHGLKKVTVASDKPEGLAAGLDKAKQMVAQQSDPGSDPDIEKLEEETGEDLDHDNEEGEAPEHASQVAHEGNDEDDEQGGDDSGPISQEEIAEMSEDEVDKVLQELMARKEQLQAKKA